MLISEYGGEVPQTMDELVSLPGVGRKTANVVLSNAFEKPAIAVDTHVARVSNLSLIHIWLLRVLPLGSAKARSKARGLKKAARPVFLHDET